MIATVYFNAIGAGSVSLVGSPTDASPFQDTLLFGSDDPVDRSLLRFSSLDFTIDAGAPNQNSSLNLDVNDDGLVSPIDALLVINKMNRDSVIEGEQTGNSGSNGGKRYYTDVNGDNKTTALDALQVINYLSRSNSNQASGEQIVLLSDSKEQLSVNSGSDAFFADLASDDSGKIASFDSTRSTASNADTDGSNGESKVGEDDDIYSVLADDVDGHWA